MDLVVPMLVHMVVLMAMNGLRRKQRRGTPQNPCDALYSRPRCGRSSAVERQPSKLNVEGSIPFARFI